MSLKNPVTPPGIDPMNENTRHVYGFTDKQQYQ